MSTGTALLLAEPGSRSSVTGVFSLALAVVLLSPAVAAAAVKPALTVLLSLATARAACQGLYDLTGARGLQTAAGVVAMLDLVVSVYGGLALLLEDTRGHLVLPTGRRRRARDSPRGRPRRAAGVAESEAGVRNQL